MRNRWIAIFVVAILLLAGCSDSQIVDTANGYLDHIEAGEFEEAYELLSPQLRKAVDFERFSEFMVNPEDNTSVDDMDIAFEADSFSVYEDGQSGCVYGVVSLEGQNQKFRLPIMKDLDVWWIDGAIIEQEPLDQPGYYVSTFLRNYSQQFFDLILDAEVEKLWEKTSKRIRDKMTIDEYRKVAISTQSGETPRNEGYSIMIGPAYTTEPKRMDGQMKRQGFVVASIVFGDMENPEIQAQVKADFIFEDGEWKCDFDRLEEMEEANNPRGMTGR